MPDHGFQFLRRGFPGVAQVDLVVETPVVDVQFIALLLHESMHPLHRGGLVVIGPGVNQRTVL
jgi:hypothetical protein